MEIVFKGLKKIKTLDYVACWFYKGALYIKDTNASLALVATNSINQGEQVALLWPLIFKLGLNINFAYQTFQWKNSAKNNAGVHVVVVGLSNKNTTKNKIYKLVDDTWHKEIVGNISPYLVSGSNTVIEGRRSSISGNSPILFGNMPYDYGNLLLNTEEKNELVLNEPSSEQWLKRIIGSDEFLNSKERWCLWLVGISNEELEEELRKK